jgi:hypothetical protein
MTIPVNLNDNHKPADNTLVLDQPPPPSTTDPAAELFKAEGYGKVEAGVKVKKRSADAERKETHREKLKQKGLGQLNLIVPIAGPTREILHHLARIDLDAGRSEAVRTVAENEQIAELSVRLGAGPEPVLKCLTPRQAVHILRRIDQEPAVRSATSAIFEGGHIAGLVRCLCQEKVLVEMLHLALSDHTVKRSGGFLARARTLLSLTLYLWRRGK